MEELKRYSKIVLIIFFLVISQHAKPQSSPKNKEIKTLDYCEFLYGGIRKYIDTLNTYEKNYIVKVYVITADTLTQHFKVILDYSWYYPMPWYKPSNYKK
jgi:hypothetical protein